MSIHSTAIVAAGARVHADAEVGPYAIIGPDVVIGAQTVVGAHAVIDGDTTIGQGNHIFHHASVGAPPQDLKHAGEKTKLVIGDRNQIREFATLHTGTVGGGGVTVVGDDNLFMAYSHVAHDCRVGNRCVLANAATLAGHVEVGDFVTVGGLSGVHQFSRLGSHAFLAGGTMVVMDIPPYCMAQGDRAELAGLNAVGLTRRGFSEAQVARIKDSYRIVFRSKLGLAEALERLKTDYAGEPEIELFIGFLASSKRGITR